MRNRSPRFDANGGFMRLATLILMSVTLLGGACTEKVAAPVAATTAQPPIEHIASTQQVMLGLTIPASDVLFQVGENVPQDDGGWDRITATAAMLAESGNLLLVGPRNLAQPDWTQLSRELVARARTAMDAAQKRDVDALLNAGNDIYEVCEGCHAKYMPAKVAEQAAATPAP
jgi:hypothetical protein